ncbi:hypothetical protein GPECTOR_7g1086 [Gonium pectorale]|uniref:Phytanoyl-CoA dioxygenase n=1 Tax=Gonium pectorale TaxID=33097 RepID=A0A150GTW7_GONPE|nr:hypothetical protein GPECTOR_7g1086 [Gonium pectorale]|eukprot:KXZ53193.1 hypothetical protein GPECTOR_7g1086 [Gonium pectorale]
MPLLLCPGLDFGATGHGLGPSSGPSCGTSSGPTGTAGVGAGSGDPASGATGATSGLLPAYCTVWVALTDATPDNGCIYVVPADLDPRYPRHPLNSERAAAGDGDEDGGNGEAHSRRAKEALAAPAASSRSSGVAAAGAAAAAEAAAAAAAEPPGGDPSVAVTDPQAVRALPAAAGEALIWSGQLLHWGGAADAEPDCSACSRSCHDGGAGGDGLGAARTEPRVAMSFATADPRFEPHGLRGVDLSGGCGQLPSLRQRLTLVCVQAAVHDNAEPLAPGLRAVLRRLEGWLEHGGGGEMAAGVPGDAWEA